MKISPGPKLKRIVVKRLRSSWIGLALISTPWPIRNASSPGSTKDGSVVVNDVTCRGCCRGVARPLAGWASESAIGYMTGARKRPVIVSPRPKIAWTLLLATSCLKSVYGTVAGASGPGNSIRPRE